MDIEVSFLSICQQPAEVFESDAIAIDGCILARNEEVSKVEIFLHEESNIDGSNCEEKPSSILLHLHH